MEAFRICIHFVKAKEAEAIVTVKMEFLDYAYEKIKSEFGMSSDFKKRVNVLTVITWCNYHNQS